LKSSRPATWLDRVDEWAKAHPSGLVLPTSPDPRDRLTWRALVEDEVLAELRPFCKDRLAAVKVPGTFEIVDEMGRSEAGKINRRALAEA
jgi:acyl-CoA synthetase (AMP-forming)/AMP-acid ligase II